MRTLSGSKSRRSRPCDACGAGPPGPRGLVLLVLTPSAVSCLDGGAAAGPQNGRVVFAGGTPNPYNYDVASDAWEVWPAKPVATMDHRAFAVLGERMYIIGGMTEGRRVTARVQRLTVGEQGRVR